MIQQYCQTVLAYTNAHPFTTGAASGILLILLLFLLMKLAFWHVAKRCPGIVMTDDLGSVSVSAQAVFDLVRSLNRNFPSILIKNVELLHDKQKAIYLRITVDTDPTGTKFTLVCTDFKKCVLDSLRDMFGITSIARIELHVRKSQPGQSPDGLEN